jgi:hypothetical protein
LTKKRAWLHSGQFVHILIWSPCFICKSVVCVFSDQFGRIDVEPKKLVNGRLLVIVGNLVVVAGAPAKLVQADVPVDVGDLKDWGIVY